MYSGRELAPARRPPGQTPKVWHRSSSAATRAILLESGLSVLGRNPWLLESQAFLQLYGVLRNLVRRHEHQVLRFIRLRYPAFLATLPVHLDGRAILGVNSPHDSDSPAQAFF